MDLADCVYLSPDEIHYSQDSISNTFTHDRNGKHWRIGETLDELVKMKTFVTAIPAMYVVQFNDKWFSRNNRRLWVFRNLQLMKCIEYIPVRVSKGLPATQLTTLTGGNNVEVRGDHCSEYLKKFLSSQRAAQLEKVNALHKPTSQPNRPSNNSLAFRPRFTIPIKNTPRRCSKTYHAIVRKYKQKLMMSQQERERYKKVKASQKGYDFHKAKTEDMKPKIDFVSEAVGSRDVFQFGRPDGSVPLTPILSLEKNLTHVQLFPATPMQYTDNENLTQVQLLPATPLQYTDHFGFPNTPAIGVGDGVSTPQIPITPCNFSTMDESTNWAELDWPRQPETVMDRQMACLRQARGTQAVDYGNYNQLNTPVPLDNIRINMTVPKGGKRKREKSRSPVQSKRRQHDDGSCHTVSSTTDVIPSTVTYINPDNTNQSIENITRTVTITGVRKKKTARRRNRCAGKDVSSDRHSPTGRVLYYDNYEFTRH